MQFSISNAYTRSFVSPEEYHWRSNGHAFSSNSHHTSLATYGFSMIQHAIVRLFSYLSSDRVQRNTRKRMEARKWSPFVTRKFDRVRALDVSIIFSIGRYPGDWLAINNSPEPAWLKIDFYFTDNYRSWIAFRTVRPFASHLRYSSFAKLYIIDYLIHVLL